MGFKAAAATADDEFIVSTGKPLPEEARILNSCPIEEVCESVLGEDLVFDVSTRMLGKRIDEFDELPHLLTEDRPKKGASRHSGNGFSAGLKGMGLPQNLWVRKRGAGSAPARQEGSPSRLRLRSAPIK